MVRLQTAAPYLAAALSALLLLNWYSIDPLFSTISPHAWSVVGRQHRVSVLQQQEQLQQRSGAGGDFEYLMGDKGYTFCASEEPSMLTSAKYIITQFRRKWKSLLPISIAHCSELSRATTDELHRLHREAVIKEFGQNATALSMALLETVDICGPDASVQQKKRLRGWFCKTMALAQAPFRQVMLIDTDVVWLNNPDLLFDAPCYVSTGALFFRDRLLFEAQKKGGKQQLHQREDGLRYGEVLSYIEHHSRDFTPIVFNTNTSTQTALKLLHNLGGGANYFWRPAAVDPTAPKLRHVQESSVVLLNRANHPRTLGVLRRLLPTFSLGYGDKEIYWIAATIASEPYAFEPYLAGIYGDCGEVFHFDPRPVATTVAGTKQQQPQPAPFFINGQFIAEAVEFEGKGLQPRMSRPLFASAEARLNGLQSLRNAATGGNCGGCADGCTRVPTDVSAAVVEQQQFQLRHVDPLWKDSWLPGGGKLYYLFRRMKARFVPAWYN